MEKGEKDRILSTSPAKTPPFLRHITVIARMWTLMALIVMWAAAIYIIIKGESTTHYIGLYLIGASVLVTFFELAWMINKSMCCRKEGCCCACWTIVMWVDNWKKGIFYLLLSIPVFLEGMRIVLGIVSGFLLIASGVLYILKTFKEGIVYTVTETQYIPMQTPNIKCVTNEISTQTEDDKYYQELSGQR